VLDLDFVLSLLSRWLHILAAITAVGGTIFARLALLPALPSLPEGHRKTLHDAIRGRWSKAVMGAIAFLLMSGLYNFIRIAGRLPADLKPLYHPLFGAKFVLALIIFFIASALVGKSTAFERFRANARFWLTLNLVLAVLLVCISGLMRMLRDRPAQPIRPVNSVSAVSVWPIVPQLPLATSDHPVTLD
jgi:uncharacterized membrane protein